MPAPEAKRERVGTAYPDLLVTAPFILQRAKAMGWLSPIAGGSPKVEQVVRQKIAALEHSLASLLEGDAKGVVEIFGQTLKVFGEYGAVFARGIGALVRPREARQALLRELTEVERRVPELEGMARRHLSSLAGRKTLPTSPPEPGEQLTVQSYLSA